MRDNGLLWTGLASLVCGIGGTALVGSDIATGSAQSSEGRAWPSVEGRVERSWVDHESSYGGRFASSALYVPRVAYSYAVNGRTYSNDRLSLVKEEGFREVEEAEAELEAYPPQTSVQVHYRPEQPADSALVIEGVTWHRYVGLVFCVLVALFGIWCVKGHFQERRAASGSRRRGRDAQGPGSG